LQNKGDVERLRADFCAEDRAEARATAQSSNLAFMRSGRTEGGCRICFRFAPVGV